MVDFLKIYKSGLLQSREGIVLHSEGLVIFVNPEAGRLLEVDCEKAVGRPLMVVLRDHRLEIISLHQKSEVISLREKIIDVSAKPGLLLMLDVTEERNRISALEESSRVLAHEFRTPVTGMASLIEALRAGLSEEETTEVLGLLNQEAERLKRLVEDLPLDKPPSSARTFPLSELIPRLERLLESQVTQGGFVLEWDLRHSVKANPDSVYQVLLNLIENSIKYSTGKRIEIHSGEKNELNFVEVIDIGPHILDHEPLFTPGRRGVHGANVRGTGLGLSLVRRLAESWNGSAYGRSWDQGNAFGVTFPS